MARSSVTGIVVHWLPTVAWASLIFYLSSQPDIQLPGTEFVLKDKVAHGLAYGALCALVIFGARTARRADFVRGVGLLGVIAYGFLDEIHQKFVPGRHCEANDFLADAVGAIGIYLLFSLTQGPRQKSPAPRNAKAG
jgi:VanZ family protein